MRQGVIAAISTPPGKGGVAIIRMCGEGALALAEEVFFSVSGKKIPDYPPRTQIYGYIIEKEEKLDDCLLTYFPGGSSYTGEETVEISCHGGVLITRTILETLFTHGALPAVAGEFTRRAFVNGRLSLTEAEAIGSLLEARGREQLRLNSKDSRSRLAREIEKIRQSITETLSSIYARIDYPEEDLGEFTDGECLIRLRKIKEELDTLIETYRTGRAINEGINAVIVGKPNVGKSTVYNLLLGTDAAIVTDLAGTTRDLLEQTLPLGRVLLRLCDTAGIREGSSDTVEKIGIERSLRRLREAELALCVFDLSRPFDKEDEELISALKSANCVKLCLLNKGDTANRFDFSANLPDGLFEQTVTISARESEADSLRLITSAVEELFLDEKISPATDAIVASARQHGSLVRARDLIGSAILAYEAGIPTDAASSDIEMALGAIGELDGRAVSESVTADIFAKFCVGK